MGKRFYSGLLFFFLCFSATLPGAAQDTAPPAFLQNLNDVPLMPGLYELLDEGLVFDKPEGRIVEAAAAAELSKPSEVVDFYERTLPQLGWSRLKFRHYEKDGEALEIAVEQAAEASAIVRFTVMPAAARRAEGPPL